MKTNYQSQTDAVISALAPDTKPTLLLHSCCGPCSSYVLEYLVQHFDVTVLFYGPNIQPREEYDKRLLHQRRVLEHFPAKILECEYDGEAFDELVKGLETEREGGSRCTRCFELRIGETARLAAHHGFQYYCTTLTVSPHKDAERINRIGQEMGEKYGIKWLPSDFKKREGYKRSIELSREWDIYRQDYCGCLYSKPQNDE